MREITDKQHELLECVMKFIEEKGYSPTIGELATARKVTKRAAYDMAQSLRAKGALSWVPGLARTMRVVDGNIDKM